MRASLQRRKADVDDKGQYVVHSSNFMLGNIAMVFSNIVLTSDTGISQDLLIQRKDKLLLIEVR